MSTKMHSILSMLVILALVALTTAFPNGSGTCNSNATVIGGVMGQPMGTLKTDLGYTFAVTMENNNYIPGGPPVKFCVHGKDPFKGLLLYALDVAKNHVGEWLVPSTDYKILNLNCLGDPKGTITHANPNLKGPNVCFQYKSPMTDVGPINFVGTVVKSKLDGFQIIRFETIFVVKDSKFVTTATMTTTTCMQQPPYTKTYENTKPPYEKPTYKTTYNKPPYEKPTYEPTYNKPPYEKPTYEKPTYEPTYNKPPYEKPTYEPTYNKPPYEKPTYEKPTYEMPTYEPTYKPTGSNDPIGDFKPPDVSAANGITYTGFILLLQLMIVSSLIIYYH
ncbi:hypothetical protein Glove_615g28 [Diversispora epigaea]|uniref:Reelin domain-containing protein n=1 Tax=Diversispora epigaea TaxID=1348612 RepID=A0A397GEN9_9GLOM|nr:hypothetical protein Glove_615g28 [Diversispora epigaea]